MTERTVERRAHPRAQTSLPITIGAADRRIAARVRDLSRSGVCFVAPTPLKEMTAVKVDLELPGAKPTKVHAEGAVVRCLKSNDDYEVAIFFTSIGEEDRTAIGRLVEAQLQPPR